MDSPSDEALGTLSRRGHSYATGTKMTLEQVINDLWDPKDNPDGFVSLGVAENVQQSHRNRNCINIADMSNAGADARRTGKLH